MFYGHSVKLSISAAFQFHKIYFTIVLKTEGPYIPIALHVGKIFYFHELQYTVYIQRQELLPGCNIEKEREILLFTSRKLGCQILTVFHSYY